MEEREKVSELAMLLYANRISSNPPFPGFPPHGVFFTYCSRALKDIQHPSSSLGLGGHEALEQKQEDHRSKISSQAPFCGLHGKSLTVLAFL